MHNGESAKGVAKYRLEYLAQCWTPHGQKHTRSFKIFICKPLLAWKAYFLKLKSNYFNLYQHDFLQVAYKKFRLRAVYYCTVEFFELKSEYLRENETIKKCLRLCRT